MLPDVAASNETSSARVVTLPQQSGSVAAHISRSLYVSYVKLSNGITYAVQKGGHKAMFLRSLVVASFWWLLANVVSLLFFAFSLVALVLVTYGIQVFLQLPFWIVLTVEILAGYGLFRFLLRAVTFPGSLFLWRRVTENQLRRDLSYNLMQLIGVQDRLLQGLTSTGESLSDVGAILSAARGIKQLASLHRSAVVLEAIHLGDACVDQVLGLRSLDSFSRRVGMKGNPAMQKSGRSFYEQVSIVLRLFETLRLRLRPEVAAALRSMNSAAQGASNTGNFARPQGEAGDLISFLALFLHIEKNMRKSPEVARMAAGVLVDDGSPSLLRSALQALNRTLCDFSDYSAAMKRKQSAFAAVRSLLLEEAPIGSFIQLGAELMVSRGALRLAVPVERGKVISPAVKLDAVIVPARKAETTRFVNELGLAAFEAIAAQETDLGPITLFCHFLEQKSVQLESWKRESQQKVKQQPSPPSQTSHPAETFKEPKAHDILCKAYSMALEAASKPPMSSNNILVNEVLDALHAFGGMFFNFALLSNAGLLTSLPKAVQSVIRSPKLQSAFSACCDCLVPTVMYCGPNAGTFELLSLADDWLKFYLSRNVSLFAWNYRGFGFSDGRPSPSSVATDGRLMARIVAEGMAWRRDPPPLGVHGRSIGGIACCAVGKAMTGSIAWVCADRTFSSLEAAGRALLGGWAHYAIRLGGFSHSNIADFMSCQGYKVMCCDPHDEVIRDVASLKVGISDSVAADRISEKSGLDDLTERLAEALAVLDYIGACTSTDEGKAHQHTSEAEILLVLSKYMARESTPAFSPITLGGAMDFLRTAAQGKQIGKTARSVLGALEGVSAAGLQMEQAIVGPASLKEKTEMLRCFVSTLLTFGAFSDTERREMRSLRVDRDVGLVISNTMVSSAKSGLQGTQRMLKKCLAELRQQTSDASDSHVRFYSAVMDAAVHAAMKFCWELETVLHGSRGSDADAVGRLMVLTCGHNGALKQEEEVWLDLLLRSSPLYAFVNSPPKF